MTFARSFTKAIATVPPPFANKEIAKLAQAHLGARSFPFRDSSLSRPPVAQLPDSATEELRELARLRERLAEDFASRLRQLHRPVELGFPEFTRYVRTLENQLSTTILSRYPTAASFNGASVKSSDNLRRVAQGEGTAQHRAVASQL